MAAHMNPNLSTMATSSSEVDIPMVEVFTRRNGVVLKIGEGGAQQTTARHEAEYSTAPYNFSAVDSAGQEPFIKTFGSLLNCSGGTLTIRQKSYRIVVPDDDNAFGEREIKRQKSFAALPVTDKDAAVQKIKLGGLELATPRSMLRDDWDSAWPSSFDIGAQHLFDDPILQHSFFAKFSWFVNADKAEGSRRGCGTLVAMPGWGKTFALTLLAKLPEVCRWTSLPKGQREAAHAGADGDSKQLFAMLNDMLTKENKSMAAQEKKKVSVLARCVPLAVTFNSNMTLPPAETGHDYNCELAKRLAFAYLASPKTSFAKWVAAQNTTAWNCEDVLTGLRYLAETACPNSSPIMLLLIDEPDHKRSASRLIAAMADTALLQTFCVDCRVVVSALEQEWLLREVTASGRPLIDLQLQPPQPDLLQKRIFSQLHKHLLGTVGDGDRSAVAKYITSVAGGHWRSIFTTFKAIVQSGQLTADALMLAAGDAQAYIPTTWRLYGGSVMGQLDEALAHSILGSTLAWMEPLANGTAWKAVESGVIRQYLGFSGPQSVIPTVPLLLVLRLAERSAVFEDELTKAWGSHFNHEVRDERLCQVLGLARFHPRAASSSLTPKHQLFESLTAVFMLLRWDALARIERTVWARWSLSGDNLLSVPEGISEDSQRLNYDSKQVLALRDASNQAWADSINIPLTTTPPNERPRLWLVPPLVPPKQAWTEHDLRLHVFRGASRCIKNDKSLQVFAPDAEKAQYYKCSKKLCTTGATIEYDDGSLPPGAVIEPAKGNDGFDLLILFDKADCQGSAFALIENKFVAANIDKNAVTSKIDTLKKYRGCLWKDPNGNEADSTNSKSLRLPSVDESDIVWVLLADEGWTGDLPRQIESELSGKDKFLGQVLLTTSETFFGKCFGKIGLLSKERY